jgi:ribose/xylose/arabinose/galactoside ABC-type transport system permease subunit
VFDPRRDGEDAIAQAAVPREVTAGRGGKPAGGLATRISRVREAGILAAVVGTCVVLGVLRPAQFATTTNLLEVLANAALPAIMAQGVMLIICAGGIDISIGSMLGLLAATASMCAVSGAPPAMCLGLSMSLGIGCSLLNAGTSLLARIHPIIVTLAGISVYRGAMHVVTGGREVINLPAGYRALADGTLLGVPKICYYVIGVTVLIHVLLEYTLVGRRILALGNSESAARLIGISKARSTLAAFAISGTLVGLAAVLHSGYYGKVQGNTGEGWELRAIAAAVIGGTNILGGRGSALGTLLGAVLVALLYNALILLDVSAYWQHLFIGGLILCAVSFDVALQRRREVLA